MDHATILSGGIQEMSLDEIDEVSGGIAPIIILGAIAITAIAAGYFAADAANNTCRR